MLSVRNGSLHNRHKFRECSVHYTEDSSFLESDSSSDSEKSDSIIYSDPIKPSNSDYLEENKDDVHKNSCMSSFRANSPNNLNKISKTPTSKLMKKKSSASIEEQK